MTDNRRHGGMSDEEIDQLAEILNKKLAISNECKLTPEQQEAVIDLLAKKKQAVRLTLWLMGAVVLWVLKDVYLYIIGHITWGR